MVVLDKILRLERSLSDQGQHFVSTCITVMVVTAIISGVSCCFYHTCLNLTRVWSVRVAKWLALPTSDHEVAGSNPAGGEILPEPKWHFIAQSLSCSPFHRLEMTEILLKGRKTLTHPSIDSSIVLVPHSSNSCLEIICHNMRKPVWCHMRTTKLQISLCIHAVWSMPLLFTA